MSDTLQQDDVIVTSSTFGATGPVYTWRKGGTDDTSDNHFYLIIGSAADPVVKATNTLIEINPDTKLVKFWGKTELLDGLKLQENSLDASTLIDGTLKASKLEPNISISGSVTKLTTARNIDGIAFDGTKDVNHYITVSTAAATANKTASITNFKLVTGSSVYVKFTQTNTAATPTLNISETGAKQIWYDNKIFTGLKSNRAYHLVYDGSHYQVVGEINTDTNNKVKQTPEDASADDFNVLLTSTANKTTDTNDYSKFSTHFKYNPATSTLKAKTFASDLNTQLWINGSKGNAILSSTTDPGNYVAFLKYPALSGVFTLSGYKDTLVAVYQDNDTIAAGTNKTKYQATLLDATGTATFPATVKAVTFSGNATSATKAINDRYDNVIDETYLKIADASKQYLKLTGGTVTGVVKLKAVNGESNTQASTVGYVDSAITAAKAAVKDEILNGAGDGYESLKDLSDLIKNNKDAIDTIKAAATGTVKYDQSQALTDAEKLQARTNIAAFATSGGTISGNVSLPKILTVGTVNASNHVTVKDTNINASAAPAANITTGYYVTETNNKPVGYFNVRANTNNTTTASMRAYQMVASGSQKSAEINVAISTAGVVSTYAPTPAASSNTTNIATTAWVRTLLGSQSNIVSTKSYTGILSNTAKDTLYYATVTPSNQTSTWHIQLKFDITTPYTDYQCGGYIDLVGIGNKCSYQYWLNDKTDKLAISGFDVAMTSAGPHYLGFNFSQATNPSTTGYGRIINLTLYDQTNCTLAYIATPSNASANKITNATITSVIAVKSGYYVESTDTNGDRLSTWGRIAAAGSTGLFQNTLAAENAGGSLVSLISNKSTKAVITEPIDPQSVVLYTGTDIAANSVATVDGKIFNTCEFDADNTFNSITTFSTNARLFLKGKINYNTGLITLATSGTLVSSLPHASDGYQYVHIGYASGSSGKHGYLTPVHTVYAWKNGGYNRISVNPCVNNPATNSNDATVATTKWVKDTIKNNLRQTLSLVNPTITTTANNDITNITIRAASGMLTKGTIPTTSVKQNIFFADGTTNEDPNTAAMACLEYEHTATQSSLTIATLDPTNKVSNSSDANIILGYKKSGATWVPFVQTTSPKDTSNDSSIATTEWVHKQLEIIDGGEL